MSYSTKIKCPVSGIELIEVSEEGTLLLASHAKCTRCSRRYYLGYFYSPPPESDPPIEYKGLMCKGCINVLMDHENYAD